MATLPSSYPAADPAEREINWLHTTLVIRAAFAHRKVYSRAGPVCY